MSQCTICRDNFDDIQRIAATHCGHVYHYNCISEWLTRTNTCPECRSRTSVDKILVLYFNPSASPNTSVFAKGDTLRGELASLQRLLEEEHNNCEELRNRVKQAEQEVSDLKQEVLSRRTAEGTLKRKLLETGSELELSKEERDRLRGEMQLYRDVKQVVLAADGDARTFMHQMTGSTEQVTGNLRSLAFCISITKRELKKVMDDRERLVTEKHKLSKELHSKSAQLHKANLRIRELQEQLKGLPAASYSPATCTPPPKDDSPFVLTPISAGFEKPKMNIVIKGRVQKRMKIDENVGPPSPEYVAPSRLERGESVTAIGYDGLGSHHTIVNRSKDIVRPKISRIKNITKRVPKKL